MAGAARAPGRDARRHAVATLRRGSDAGHAPDARGRGRLPRLLEEPRHRRDAALAAAARRGVGPARAHRRDVPRRQASTSPRIARCCTWRCARPKGASIVVDGRNVVADVHAVLDKMAAFANRIRSGDWKGHTGKRIRNVINIGIGGSDLGPVMAYEALKFYSDRAMTFRFVSNVDGTDFAEAVRDLDAAGDAVHHLVEDVHHARDDDQRAHGARLGASPGLGGDAKAVAKHFVAVSTNDAKVSRVRHRHREHVRVLGLGRRPLLDGLGDRPFDDARRRARQLPRDAGGLPRDGRALPHRAVRAQPAGAAGPPRALVQRFLRRADGRRAALRAVPQALSRLPAAAHDGEQRQARDARRRARRLRHGPDLLGRARHQRPALVLPAHPPGHAAHPLRLHRVREGAQPARAGITTC